MMLMFIFYMDFSWYTITQEVRVLPAHKTFSPTCAVCRERLTNPIDQSASSVRW